ncbi:sugar phosphate isomerase/epimerase family protein [Phytoactinopolyspora mesophila]|uniref:sugar phosphate isomerase/epimerase family protein n=1 Tax=Phytoactinopolyspora mesophila TaxID=2650750 RepID=UPI001C9E9A42|nr:TIM barrel protein [Phytoactinopolyspora mesophila]
MRALSVEEVLDVAVRAGLRCVEWGGDIHVPAGDVATARRVAALTSDAGLAVASYGSYFRAGASDDDEFGSVVASAAALGATRIRIWAGTLGSAEADAAYRRAVVESTRRAADLAAAEGIALGYEFHGNTLTDDVDSALRLLAEVGRDNVTSYWQPPNGMADAAAVETLRRLGDIVPAVHVFSWWPGTERLPLGDRAALWQDTFAVLRDRARPVDALMEFVPGDDPSNVVRDAAELRRLIMISDRQDNQAG